MATGPTQGGVRMTEVRLRRALILLLGALLLWPAPALAAVDGPASSPPPAPPPAAARYG